MLGVFGCEEAHKRVDGRESYVASHDAVVALSLQRSEELCDRFGCER